MAHSMIIPQNWQIIKEKKGEEKQVNSRPKRVRSKTHGTADCRFSLKVVDYWSSLGIFNVMLRQLSSEFGDVFFFWSWSLVVEKLWQIYKTVFFLNNNNNKKEYKMSFFFVKCHLWFLIFWYFAKGQHVSLHLKKRE